MRQRLDRVYTSMEEAVTTLADRRSFAVQPPRNGLEVKLLEKPYMVLFRQVASPNYELFRFLSLAKDAGLTPLVLEFERDLFVDRNPDKRALVRMRFNLGKGRNGGTKTKALNVSDPNAANGRQLRDVQTKWGEQLMHFHRTLLNASIPPNLLEIYDCSDWFIANGGRAMLYYPSLFELFLQHAILVESYLLSQPDLDFTTRVVLPAFESVETSRRKRPLICRLDPPDQEGAEYWFQYPPEIHARAQIHIAEWKRDHGQCQAL